MPSDSQDHSYFKPINSAVDRQFVKKPAGGSTLVKGRWRACGRLAREANLVCGLPHVPTENRGTQALQPIPRENPRSASAGGRPREQRHSSPFIFAQHNRHYRQTTANCGTGAPYLIWFCLHHKAARDAAVRQATCCTLQRQECQRRQLKAGFRADECAH
ncbi:hypothetical protein SKAU_G00072920 [Synaphobranchus kaupii]|uniref:Uncharacterized protein n=1 Tax=Synaphobranchus kaupii TaxID=118154 RepID=A0A9Q1JBX4_SYNKA|nr:hypothetical protein SKAU_G00072920 [Synaphobranchus kaupii]